MTIEWRKVAGQMRADLDRADINAVPRLVLVILIKATLMKGRTLVVIPTQASLAKLLRKHKQHMAGPIAEIESARIATFRPVGDGWECVVNPDASQWVCEWVCSREEIDQWINWLDRVPGQAQGSLLPPEPNLRQAVAEVGAEAVSNGGQGGNKVCYPPPPVVPPPVTKFVTPKGPEVVPCTPLSFQSSKPSSAFSVERSKGGKLAGENELMDRCRELFGEKIMDTYGGNWRLRARADAGKLQRVLDDTAAAMREGRVKTIPAAYANDAWGRFK